MLFDGGTPLNNSVGESPDPDLDSDQARSQGGCDAPPPPKSAKRSTFSHKVGQKWGFCRRVRGGEVQKSPLFGSKRSTFSGFRTPQKSILATGLTRTQWVSPSPSPDSSPDSDSTPVDSDSDSTLVDSDSGLMDSDSDSIQVDSDSQGVQVSPVKNIQGKFKLLCAT